MVNQASNPATGAAYADILTSERLARTYASLLTSRPVIEETARRLGVDVESLQGAVLVTPVRETQLL
jgi:capsular polysaccharide biosynthesis protein